MKKIFVSDVTLSLPDAGLSFRERLDMAMAIEKTGVNAIELPLLSGSKEDEVIYKTISSSVKNCSVSIPVGITADSVKSAYQCVKDSVAPCLQVILPVSTLQMEYMYHLKAAKLLPLLAELCKSAADTGCTVEFVAKDASRAEDGFIEQCCKTAFDNGAEAITLCDDNGDLFPHEFAELVKKAKSCCGAKVYVSPSNKLNMAAANAIYAVEAGADGVKCAAIGDEALSLACASDIFRARGAELDAEVGLDVKVIHSIISALSPTPSRSITDSSIEITNTTQITLDKNAALPNVVAAVTKLGYELSSEDNGKVFEAFKRVISKKDVIGTKELEAVIASSAMQVPSTFHVVNYVVNSGNTITATASVTLERDGEELHGVSMGDGPIDAAFHAIEQIVGHKYELDDFQIQAVTKGREAVGSSLIRLRDEGRLYSGNGVSTDILGACIRAYVNALNKIVYEEK